ncbi:hypothetical protein AAFF_G00191010 [Aldrovandia affinis]|uniref:Uncharacterized protein n=1 Tax=Aldrovandia affinis TaxID=143900 RepID=A0AAD7RJ97_9TELE|nr:hypothetical protein AAFF_G00191010 [Aldrovandia affinis]
MVCRRTQPPFPPAAARLRMQQTTTASATEIQIKPLKGRTGGDGGEMEAGDGGGDPDRRKLGHLSACAASPSGGRRDERTWDSGGSRERGEGEAERRDEMAAQLLRSPLPPVGSRGSLSSCFYKQTLAPPSPDTALTAIPDLHL